MRMSRRARRMEQHHKRRNIAGLNMVSLMDIFTILVFFLLVNSSNVQPSGNAIKLPEARAEQYPKETLVVFVNDKDIIVQDRKVADVQEIMNGSGAIIEPLKAELDYQAARRPIVAPEDGQPVEREVTIMGDREIPYKLLKRIMVTCSQSSFSLVSLAVIRKEVKSST